MFSKALREHIFDLEFVIEILLTIFLEKSRFQKCVMYVNILIKCSSLKTRNSRFKKIFLVKLNSQICNINIYNGKLNMFQKQEYYTIDVLEI